MSHSLSLGAVDEEGRMPSYAEECASMLAVTFSGGDKMLRSIVSASPGPPILALPTILLSGGTTIFLFVLCLPVLSLRFLFPSRAVSLRVFCCWQNRAEDSK